MKLANNAFTFVALLASLMIACECQFTTSLFTKLKHTTTPLGCIDYLQEGIYEDGYYTLYDTQDRRYTAYCDFSTEPGSAWTLIVSFSRYHLKTDPSEVLKRKSLGENGPFNQDSPNWYAFRAGKSRIDALKRASSHFRMTCSAKGPFTGIKHLNDYVRVNFTSLNPLTLNVVHERCTPVEYASIRNVSCTNCKVGFAQRKDAWSLHVDSWLSQNKCGMKKVNDQAVHSEDNFGFYDDYNTKFTCTNNDLSTTQIWFGARLSNVAVNNNNE